eukprot:CAMPEP_0177788528 /NCGR_PEP_ID=MMETSP0491_2-20121128/22178_1 /TAXON_ID=63592 /ORGANISM="Tetraselmis chuii, Strain PLY429" /LENGTH=53 /DNA_ID=CAMNT_0019310159 /DNA_START=44 /DNA_END=201 /DNA_ORIENTATION=+
MSVTPPNAPSTREFRRGDACGGRSTPSAVAHRLSPARAVPGRATHRQGSLTAS